MAGKIPPDAFSAYLSLGPARSYEAVAVKFNCSKKAIAKRAQKEGWQSRLAEVEAKARSQSEEKAAETISAINERHLQMVRLIQRRAIEILKQSPLSSPEDAVRALEVSIRIERNLLALENGPAQESAKPALGSFLRKLSDECPPWQVNILACTFQRGEGDPRSSRTITNLVLDLTRWLQDLAAQRAIDSSLPLREMIEGALKAENDDYKRSEMKAKVLRIEEEFGRYRAEKLPRVITGTVIGQEGDHALPPEPASESDDPFSSLARTLRGNGADGHGR